MIKEFWILRKLTHSANVNQFLKFRKIILNSKAIMDKIMLVNYVNNTHSESQLASKTAIIYRYSIKNNKVNGDFLYIRKC